MINDTLVNLIPHMETKHAKILAYTHETGLVLCHIQNASTVTPFVAWRVINNGEAVIDGDYFREKKELESAYPVTQSSKERSMQIETLTDFQEAFPQYSFLEERNGCTRYSNGEAPDSDFESAWFDNETEELVDIPE